MNAFEEREFLCALMEHKQLGIADQIDYDKYTIYSIVSHSTAIEGSTMTEDEVALLFDEGLTVPRRSFHEHLMNQDLKDAYLLSRKLACRHVDLSVAMLQSLSAAVMKNTGSVYTSLGRR